MKKLFFFLLFFSNIVQAQITRPLLHDSLFSTYYHQRVTLFESLPLTKGDIIFVGNSITDGGEWSELFNDLRIKNRGISGDVSAGVIHRIDEIANRKPEKVFLMIGTNDLARNVTPDSLLKNIYWTVKYLQQQSPSTKLYVQSILPVNAVYGKFGGHTAKGNSIKEVNKQLAQQSTERGYNYIDLHTPFSDASGNMKENLTNDGLHLNGEAYLLWKHIIFPFVYNLEAKPALIPLPQKLDWQSGYFPLHNARHIVVNGKQLMAAAEGLQKWLQQKGLMLDIATKPKDGAPYIELAIDKVTSPQLQEEAYSLQVTPQKITLRANEAKGIFYGIQTLQQLARNGVMVDACTITDWPAFAWRGYMVDVGRNYQSMQLLKQQIDVMAQYKLNIFHFHLTEDIAWRLESKKYPQLTKPEHMLRNKGAYYSEAEMKELIQYCKERYITLVPEIDMPGHSDAFTRTMGFNMQSDSGLMVVKEILKEFSNTYDLPYIHIGADEVKITNQKFVPEVTAYLQGLGKKVIGWEPGGNFTKNTIRQLWMDDGGKISNDTAIQYLDSRHLYLNHMDPLESVVTIFNRRIGGNDKGSKTALGGIICLWPDRRVEQEGDALRMNPVYPAMLAFAERSWRGGGIDGWVANIGAPGAVQTATFAEFENRLLDHKKAAFTQLPFPYVQQTATTWKLFGPFQNEGNLSKSFMPESKNFDGDKEKSALQIVGGTVVLRHWWAPLIKGAIHEPKENTTWYARTKIWSDEEKVEDFWIGFNNISRSPATDSPKEGTWDNNGSKVWVNGNEIAPPQWKRSGQKGHPEIPLTDEGYEYRTPAKISLKKGWNTVLIKAPVASFKGKDWQNPVKWMFTFIPADNSHTH